jgi:hypothetical protein
MTRDSHGSDYKDGCLHGATTPKTAIFNSIFFSLPLITTQGDQISMQ